MEISKIAKRWAPKIKHDLEQRYIALITNGVAEPAMTEKLLRRAIDEAVKVKNSRIEELEKEIEGFEKQENERWEKGGGSMSC